MRSGPFVAAIAAGFLLSLSAASAAETAAPSIQSPFTARGNEPNWILTLDGGKMVLRTMDGGAIEAALPRAELVDGAWVYRASPGDLTVSLQPKICRDTMTGMPSPISVSVVTGGKTLAGCGGNPSELIAGSWHVVSIGELKVPAALTVSVDFDVAAGQISGSSGCNRYFGGFALTGEGLSFKPAMGGSMMACEEEATKVEQAFQAAIAKVQRFDIGADGSLQLLSNDKVTIRATRKD